MEILLIVLLLIAIILLCISFFTKDPIIKLSEEIEQITLTHMQDIHQLRKKVKILEEELLIQSDPFISNSTTLKRNEQTGKAPQINEILRNQVLALYRQGLSLDQIVRQSTLPKETVASIIEENINQGDYYE